MTSGLFSANVLASKAYVVEPKLGMCRAGDRSFELATYQVGQMPCGPWGHLDHREPELLPCCDVKISKLVEVKLERCFGCQTWKEGRDIIARLTPPADMFRRSVRRLGPPLTY